MFDEGWSIVPSVCRDCPAAWNCVLGLLENLVFFAMTIGVTIVVLVIAYAGILLVLTPTNPENKSQAKKMLINAAVGLVIVLAAWLIVDKILEVLGAGGVSGQTAVLGQGGSMNCYATPTLTAPTTPDGNPGIIVTDPNAPGGVPDGIFSYQSGIEAQKPHASATLGALLSCMATKVPANVGQISSISGRDIANGTHTFQHCARSGQGGGCAHAAGSCHFGGNSCIGQSYAVDFGDEQNAAALTSAAQECNAHYILNEGDHLHVSVGSQCGCR